MKYIWSAEDVKCGRFVCKPKSVNDPDLGWHAKWTLKIGFIASSSDGTVLVAMTDGMVGSKKTPDEMVAYLNKEKMIPCPHDRLIEIINYLRDCYEP